MKKKKYVYFFCGCGTDTPNCGPFIHGEIALDEQITSFKDIKAIEEKVAKQHLRPGFFIFNYNFLRIDETDE